MRASIRYTLALCILALLAACLMAALEYSAGKKGSLKCSSLSVTIADSLENNFVSVSDIRGYIDAESGGYIGRALDSIDLAEMERIIDSKSTVLKSEAYVTGDGTLNISVTQRRPAVRFQRPDGGFYADRQGYIFPLQGNYTAYVPVVDGAIPVNASGPYKGKAGSEKEQEWIDSIIRLVTYMEESGVWDKNIVQITVRGNGDLVLVPRQGKEKFLFGKPDNIEDKFSRMEKYYTGIVPEKGEGYYSTVNLKYNGQIVCRK